MHHSPPRQRTLRPGVAYVLAMLYLMLFAVLAIGFCSASTMSVQISRDDRHAADAQAAAESGMQLVRYQLSQISIPAETEPQYLLPAVVEALGRRLNGSAILNGRNMSLQDNMVYLPGESDWTPIDPALGTRFRAQIATSGPEVWVKIVGRGEDDSIRRAVQIAFKPSTRPSDDHTQSSIRLICDPATYEEVSP
jgi:Tfp pilus assembly protein PilX